MTVITIRETRNGTLIVECGACPDNPHVATAVSFGEAHRWRTLHSAERHGVMPTVLDARSV